MDHRRVIVGVCDVRHGGQKCEKRLVSQKEYLRPCCHAWMMVLAANGSYAS